MSRVKNVIVNIQYGLLLLILNIGLGFISRTVFLEHLGNDFLGVFSVFTSIFALISFVEFGINQTILTSLYDPVEKKDKSEIAKLLSIMGSLYRYVIYIYISLVILISFFIPFVIKDSSINHGVIFCLFFIMMIDQIIEYRFSYKKIIFFVEQKNYIIARWVQLVNLFKVLIQVFVLIYFNSVILWISILIFPPLVNAIIIKYFFNKLQSEIIIDRNMNIKNIFNSNPAIKIKIKQLNIHRISGLINTNMTNIYYMIFSSVSAVALVGNYNILFSSVNSILSVINISISPSVGNVIAQNDKDKIRNIFWVLIKLRAVISCFCGVCFILFTNEFISLWIGHEYILSQWVLFFLVLNLTLGLLRATIDDYILGYSLFSDIYSPVFEVIINIFVSILFGFVWGVEGIILASVITNFCIGFVWKPYFLCIKKLLIPINNYFFKMVKILLVIVAVFILSFCFHDYFFLERYYLLFSFIFTLSLVILFTFILISDKYFKSVISVILKR